jgi:hypothetical protein
MMMWVTAKAVKAPLSANKKAHHCIEDSHYCIALKLLLDNAPPRMLAEHSYTGSFDEGSLKL